MIVFIRVYGGKYRANFGLEQIYDHTYAFYQHGSGLYLPQQFLKSSSVAREILVTENSDPFG